MISKILNIMTAVLAGIAAISLLVGGIGMMNTMLVLCIERTREIGIRKALGARTGYFIAVSLIESVTLSLIGGTGGILFAGLLSFVIPYFVDFFRHILLCGLLLSPFVFSGSWNILWRIS